MATCNHVDLIQTLQGHTSDVTSIDFSSNILATCSSDKTVRLWSFDPENEEASETEHSPLLGHKYSVHCCSFSPLGNLLATCSTDGNIFLWNVENGELEGTLQHPSGNGIRVCYFSPNSILLATAGEDDSIILWDVETKELLSTYEGHDATVTACTFTPDSSFLVSGSVNCDLALWDASCESSQWIHRILEAHDLGVTSACFSPTYIMGGEKGKHSSTYLLATCGNDSIVCLWHVTVGEEVTFNVYQKLVGHSGNVMCCRFSPDGGLLASVAGDKTVIIWDPVQGAILQKLKRHTRYITCCSFSFDGQYLATGSNDKTVIIWKLHRDGTQFSVPLEHQQAIITGEGVLTTKFHPAIEKKDPSLPDEYYCPIMHEIMKDPVIAADGFSYERSAITEWFQSGKDTSPMTNRRLPHLQLTSNLILRILIRKHISQSN